MQTVTGWLGKPYSQDMDVLHWVLFIGLVVIISLGWIHVLSFFEE